MTLSALEMPFPQFLLLLGRESGISIIGSPALDNQTVTIDVKNQPISQVLSMLARRAGVEVTKNGSLYFVGTLRREDRAHLVRRVLRLDETGLKEAVGALQSEIGRIVSFSDGLCVISDKVETLQRISDMLDQVEGSETACWCVQLYLISLSASEAHKIGLDVTPAVEIAATYAAGSGSLASATDGSGARLAASLGALLKASAGNSSVGLLAQPMFYLSDGVVSKFSRGEVIPVPQRTVSNQGTVSTNAFKNVQAGLQIEALVREVQPLVGKLVVTVESSSIVGFVEQAPRLQTERYETTGIVRSGGVYLLTSVERDRVESGVSAGLFLGDSTSDERTLLQIWCRVLRVANKTENDK